MQRNVTVRFRPTQLLSVAVHGGLSLPILVLKSQSCCHTQLMFLDFHTRLECLDCRIHIEPFSSQILLLVCVAYFFATPFHFVFPQHRNAIPDIPPVPLQVTTDLMEESVFGRSVLESVVTNHESADRGSSFEPLVVVAVSRRFPLCFQVCFSCALEGCLIQHFCRTWQHVVYRLDGSSLEDLAFFRVIFTVSTVRSINPFDFAENL